MQRILILLIIIGGSIKLEAIHIVGGDAVYTCLGIDEVNQTMTIRAQFTLYKDKTIATPFDYGVSFGVYTGSGDNWTFYRSVNNIDPDQIVDVTNVGDNPCLVIPSNIKVNKADYFFELTLPWIDEEYLIVWQRCCRTASINNIVAPDETGDVLSFRIHPVSQLTCNSSPKFNDFPPIIICLNEDVNFDHSAIDAEGDSLVYEFCAPKNGGGPVGLESFPGDPNGCNGIVPDVKECLPPFEEIAYMEPTYSGTNPLGGNPQVQIDPETGLISGFPNVVGQFVVGVCVSEYREGELLNVITRDFQFNVVACDRTVVADMESDGVSNGAFFFSRCGEDQISFVNTSYEETNIRNYLWQFESNSGRVTSSVESPTIEFPGFDTYQGMLIANPNSPCGDTARIIVELYNDIDIDFVYDYDTCDAGPVTLIDRTPSSANINSWVWYTGDQDTLTGDGNVMHQYEESGSYQVTLSVSNNSGCTAEITKEIEWKPSPTLIIVEPSVFVGCAPASILFDNLTSPIDSTYGITWDFGDGSNNMDISPLHVYRDPGVYDVGVNIISPLGCEINKVFHNWIRVESSPEAAFSYTPEQPSIFNRKVEFSDLSSDAIHWLWQFDSVGISLQANPEFVFPDTGRYDVQLIVSNDIGCTDTAKAIIDISPYVTLFMPNAFTPNNDSMNDEFLGVGIRDGISDYTLAIYNRYGEKIFQTDKPAEGWNGRKNNNGVDSPSGVYIYTVDFMDPRGERVVKKGHVTLIR